MGKTIPRELLETAVWARRLRTRDMKRHYPGTMQGAYLMKNFATLNGLTIGELGHHHTFEVFSFFSALARTLDSIIDDRVAPPEDAQGHPNYQFFRRKLISSINHSPISEWKKQHIFDLISANENTVKAALIERSNNGASAPALQMFMENTTGLFASTACRIINEIHGIEGQNAQKLEGVLKNVYMAAQIADDIHDLHDDMGKNPTLVGSILNSHPAELGIVRGNPLKASSIRWLRRNAPQTIAEAENHMEKLLGSALRLDADLGRIYGRAVRIFYNHRRAFDIFSNVDATKQRMRIGEREPKVK